MPFAVGLIVGLALGGVLVVVIRQAVRGRLQPNATLATAIAVLALVFAIIALARSGSDDSTSTSDTQASSSTTVTTSAPAPTTTVPVTTTVPNVIGMSQADAQTQLTSRGLQADIETIALGGTVPPGFVLSQTPPAQSVVARGTTVVVTVSGAA